MPQSPGHVLHSLAQLAAQGDLVYGIQSLTQDDSGQRVVEEVRENFRLLSES